MKVAICSICKNERHNVAAWVETCRDADHVTVADTGSTDGTAEALEKALKGRSANVIRINVMPWRFDVARNAALSTVPADMDVCIPLDLDERFSSGWRKILDEHWTPETTKAYYTYVFNHKADGSPDYSFRQNRIHARKGYYWKYPCHEGIYPYGGYAEKTAELPPEFYIEQFRDQTKDRGGHLDLLRIGVEEFPNDSRSIHYYGRELMYCGRYKEALVYLERYMTQFPTTFPWERANNAQYIADCLRKLGR